jgi:glyoxylase-like metal-dependent hydrolase (beta-lactamase superfamily II)
MIKTQEIGPLKILFGKHPTYPYCNTVWIRDRQSLVADPSCDGKALADLAVQEKVDFLFNSHYHADHLRYNSLFDGAVFLAHRADAPCFRSLDRMAEWAGVLGTEYEKAWRSSLTNFFAFRERSEIREVEDRTRLSLGEVTLEFVHFPGHTPGLTGFLIPELEVLFLADMELSPFGPWYSNFPASIESIIESVEKIRKIPARYFIPSHGREVFKGDIAPRLDRYLENIHSRERKIVEALSSPLTVDELADLGIISKFRITRKVIWHLFERNMVKKHLDRLLAQGKISRVGNVYRRET